jgi:hypothetical protein
MLTVDMSDLIRTERVPMLDCRAEVGAVDGESRTVELIFSTGAPVLRVDWWSGKRYIEKLSMKPEHIRLDRLNAGAPLLNTHQSYRLEDQIGVIEEGSAKVSGGKATARVRFSGRADVAPILQDVKDKVIRNVSVGYRVHKFEETTGKDGAVATRTAIDWEPYEVSMVPLPADAGAQTRGATDTQWHPCVIVRAQVDSHDADRMRRLRLARVR